MSLNLGEAKDIVLFTRSKIEIRVIPKQARDHRVNSRNSTVSTLCKMQPSTRLLLPPFYSKLPFTVLKLMLLKP